MGAIQVRKAAEQPSSNEIVRIDVKINGCFFLASRQDASLLCSSCPAFLRKSYLLVKLAPESATSFDSAPASMNTFALNISTRQPRRRAESMPWSRQMSTLRSRQNSLQLKPSPQALPIPHFIQAGHERDVEMDGLADIGREWGHDYDHTT